MFDILAAYGEWPFGPEHGFARVMPWSVETPPERLCGGDVQVMFSLTDTTWSRSMFNYP